MDSIPRPPADGTPWNPAWGRAVVTALKALVPRSSPTVEVDRSSGGVVLRARVVGSRGRSSSAAATTLDTPFRIKDASTVPGTPAAKVIVVWGSVQNATPTMDSYGLDTVPEHTFTSAGTYNGYLKFNGSATTVEWSTSAVPSDTSSYGYLLIGTVTVVTSGAGYAVSDIKQNVKSSLMCRNADGTGSIWLWYALLNAA